MPAILQLVTLPFSAESPRYLYFNDRHSEAKAALQKFRCRRNVDEDLDEMRQEQQSKNEKTVIKLLIDIDGIVVIGDAGRSLISRCSLSLEVHR